MMHLTIVVVVPTLSLASDIIVHFCVIACSPENNGGAYAVQNPG